MFSYFFLIYFYVLRSISGVTAHGVVNSVVVNGNDYIGFSWRSGFGDNSSQLLAAWKQDNFVNYVGYDGTGIDKNSSFQSEAMICDRNATPGAVSIPIYVKSSLSLNSRLKIECFRSLAPQLLHSALIIPYSSFEVLTYLANCHGTCETVNKTALNFFKIDQVGLVNTTKIIRAGEGVAPYLYSGTWGSDIMIKNNYTWDVAIPSDIAAGNYVLRHETIALHNAVLPGTNAQVYPSCWNLIVKGNGTANPSGISATKFYTANEPSMRFDIYDGSIEANPHLPPYPLPGPPMCDHAIEATQSYPSVPTAEAVGVLPSK
ncbi:Endoglucanase-4 [Lachnellula suecica]|uniref:Endoglucanase-4 n=1 Tax=Lachnellula suecica TaxID=602035 RepID=A0A8T9CI67_9HELO|nr:Endoglucanase-4 [Lachnellula suecica]